MWRSESGQRSGWHDYPGELWDERKPVTWLHDWAFWKYCITEYAQGPILDLACGNGRITRQLALAGYDVVAVDINPHFLSRAQTQLPDEAKDRVQFVLQDVVELDLGQTFSLVLMTDWAFPALLTPDDQLAFFKRLAEHVQPSGVFAFNTPLPTIQQLGLVADKDGILSWPGTARTFDPLAQIETKMSGPQKIRLRHTSLSEIHWLAHLAGFEILERYGHTDCRPLQGIPGDDLTLILRKTDE